MAKGGLGKGANALFFDDGASVKSKSTETLRISEIKPNKNQPRKYFDPESMQQLADSIKEHGVLQPILVRPLENQNGYQIIAGERRFRASQMAGLNEIPVVVKSIDDVTMMELALIENLQREDLNPIEEAQGYNDLIQTYGMTQENISKVIGKSRSSIANTLRLLNLPKVIIEFVEKAELSSGHARALLGLEDEEQMILLAKKSVKDGLTVRQVEKLVKLINKNNKEVDENAIKSITDIPNSYFKEVELSLCNELNRKVKVNYAGEGKGSIELSFQDKSDLEEIVKIFNSSINDELNSLK